MGQEDLFTWIPDWLRDRLQQRATKHGQQPFVAGHSDRLETITDRWRGSIGLAALLNIFGRFLDVRGIIDSKGRRIRTDLPADMQESEDRDFGG